MGRTEKLSVVLFALTGFGNTTLEALLRDDRVNTKAVFTVKYDQPFPHYEERQLIEMCREHGVKCHYGVEVSSEEGIGLLRGYSPDLIIVATFTQILRQNVLGLPRLGVVNFHPSLLPSYRGCCPTHAVLFHDEKETGLSVHYVTERVDEGNILLQEALPIGEADNDGQLRWRLARLAGEMVPELVTAFSGTSKPEGTPQDHSLASYAPKPLVKDGYLDRAEDIDTIRRKMKAFNPLPGASIDIKGQRIAVDRFELFEDSRADGLFDGERSIDWIIGSKGIRLYKKDD